MSVIEKIRKACDLSKAGNYEEALACLSDAQNADPWNGYLIDLTWRVATMYDLSQQNNLSEKEREEFIKWLPGVLDRIENSTLARPIFQSVGGKPVNKTVPSVSPPEPPPLDAAKSPASAPVIPENGTNKKPVTKRDAVAEPEELKNVDYELFLQKRLEQQRKLMPLPSPTQEPPGKEWEETPVDVPSLSGEDWKSETEDVPGKLEYGVRPAIRLGGRFAIRSRTLLVITAVVVPLLLASGVYYFLLRSDTHIVAMKPIQRNVKPGPERRTLEEQPAEVRAQPQRGESLSAQEGGVKEKQSVQLAPQTPARRDRSAETRVSAREPDVQPSSALPPPTVRPVAPSQIPSPAGETPVAEKTAPATVDSAKLHPALTAELPSRTGPNKVTLRVFINSGGRPTRAEIVSSTDSSYNDPSIEAVMKSTFPPGEERTIVLGFVYP